MFRKFIVIDYYEPDTADSVEWDDVEDVSEVHSRQSDTAAGADSWPDTQEYSPLVQTSVKIKENLIFFPQY